MLIPSALTSSSSMSKNLRPSRAARAVPIVVLPLPGIPTSRMFCIPRPMSANTASTRFFVFPPVNRSAAAAACITSIASPLIAVTPSFSASSSSCVLAGLYTTSSTHSSFGKRLRSTSRSPLRGYMPTGVAFTISAASSWEYTFS